MCLSLYIRCLHWYVATQKGHVLDNHSRKCALSYAYIFTDGSAKYFHSARRWIQCLPNIILQKMVDLYSNHMIPTKWNRYLCWGLFGHHGCMAGRSIWSNQYNSTLTFRWYLSWTHNTQTVRCAKKNINTSLYMANTSMQLEYLKCRIGIEFWISKICFHHHKKVPLI